MNDKPDLERKAEAPAKKMAVPAAALLDALCLGAILLAAAWLAVKLGWLSILTWQEVGFGFVLIYIVSLAWRLIRKPPRT